jgi:Mg2+ and Co2+ transporter CorA
MKKSEIFDLVIDKVCEVCEVDRERVLGCCKLQSVCDARVLAVQYLRRAGLSNDDIALSVLRRTGKEHTSLDSVKRKAKGVAKMFSSYSERCLQSFAFCSMSADIKEYFRELQADSYEHSH